MIHAIIGAHKAEITSNAQSIKISQEITIHNQSSTPIQNASYLLLFPEETISHTNKDGDKLEIRILNSKRELLFDQVSNYESAHLIDSRAQAINNVIKKTAPIRLPSLLTT